MHCLGLLSTNWLISQKLQVKHHTLKTEICRETRILLKLPSNNTQVHYVAWCVWLHLKSMHVFLMPSYWVCEKHRSDVLWNPNSKVASKGKKPLFINLRKIWKVRYCCFTGICYAQLLLASAGFSFEEHSNGIF